MVKIETKRRLFLLGRIYKDGVGFMVVPKGNVKPIIFKIKTGRAAE